MTPTPTALIADDEPLLREVLRAHLATLWPELQVVAQARHGLEAVDQFELLQPTVCFLDIHMPGLTGLEVAQRVGGRAHLVFITAYDQHALAAFERGAFDYVVKPVQVARLADTIARLRERVRREQPAALAGQLLQQLAAAVGGTTTPAPAASGPLRWIRAAQGDSTRLIPAEDIDYLRSDEKYTLVAWQGDGGKPEESLIRTPLKQLVDQLDPAQFQQVHRSVVVNLAAVSRVTPVDNEKAELRFRRRPDVVPVSRTFARLFKPE